VSCDLCVVIGEIYYRTAYSYDYYFYFVHLIILIMKRFVQVLNSGPSKILKKDDSSTQTTESTNHLINTSKLKYLFDGFFKIISLEGNKLSALCQNCFKVVNGSINLSGNFLIHYKVCIILGPAIYF